jgi:excisionase family DNA binding protein
MELEEILTVSAAARLKGDNRSAVYQAVNAGRRPAFHSGRTWLLRRSDVEEWQIIGHRPGRPRDE